MRPSIQSACLRILNSRQLTREVSETDSIVLHLQMVDLAPYRGRPSAYRK